MAGSAAADASIWGSDLWPERKKKEKKENQKGVE
jgi:hypothetical protein